jgi:hypothetical protein
MVGMTTYVVTLGIAGLVLAGGFVVAIRLENKRWVKTWRAFADHSKADDLEIDVRSHAVQVWMTVAGLRTAIYSGPNGTIVACEVTPPGIEFVLRRRRISRSSSRPLPGVSETFDRAFAIEGVDREAVPHIFGPELQDRLLGFVGRVFSDGGVAASSGQIRLYRSRIPMDALHDAVLLAVSIALAVPTPLSEHSSEAAPRRP